MREIRRGFRLPEVDVGAKCAGHSTVFLVSRRDISAPPSRPATGSSRRGRRAGAVRPASSPPEGHSVQLVSDAATAGLHQLRLADLDDVHAHAAVALLFKLGAQLIRPDRRDVTMPGLAV
jgi:hypothetical protein